MSTNIYQHTIRGSPAFAELDVDLAPGQMILADGGAMTFLREGVERGSLSTGGFLSALGRGFAGESVFMNTYTGLTNGSRHATFAAPYPGDMVHVPMSAGAELLVARGRKDELEGTV